MADRPGIYGIGSDNLISVTGLQMADGTVVNNATISGVLKDDDGATIDTGGPIPFVYASGSAGDYSGVIPHTATLNEGQTYNLFITVTVGSTQMDVRVRRQAMFIDD